MDNYLYFLSNWRNYMPKTDVSSELHKKTGAILFLAIIVLICGATIFSFCSHFAFSGTREQSANAVAIDKVSVSEEYPFPAASKSPESHTGSYPLEDWSIFAEQIKENIETISTEENVLAPACYYLFGAMNRFIGKDIIEDSETNVLRVDGEKLLFEYHFSPLKDAYDSITDFSDWLQERDVDFLYVVPASKNDESLIPYPEGMEPHYYERLNSLLEFMTENGISYLDCREILLSTGQDYYGWFYNTDHHWNVRAGLLIADRIIERMAEEFHYDVDADVCDIENYKSVIYPKALLGSMGRKTTLGYTEKDDFEVLYPNFETSFCYRMPTSGFAYSGSFGESLIFSSFIGKEPYNSATAYSAFLRGDPALAHIENQLCSNGIRVLVLKESKANVVNPYLACAVQYLDIIDPRYFDGSIRAFIEKTEPDIVLICSAGPDSETDTTWTLK